MLIMIPVKENWKLQVVVWLLYNHNSMFIFLAALFIVKISKNAVFSVPRLSYWSKFSKCLFFPGPLAFCKKAVESVNSEKNILNSSVEWFFSKKSYVFTSSDPPQ